MVQGSARRISSDTGVGKAESDGPKSPTMIRLQNDRYCSHGVPVIPYNSRRDCRIVSIASGLVLPKEVKAEIVCSTGSIGVAWEIR